tara:strand:- start:596 stop:1684 length:1089 start_codon:yes stop_codon:yes gene_type:complete
MRTKINFFLIFTLIYLNLINLNAQVSDTLSYKEKLNSGEYPPFIKLTNKDKIQFPIKFYIDINIDEISDFDIKKNHFYSKFWHTYYSKLDTLESTVNNEEYYFYPEEYISLQYPEGDRVFTTEYSIDPKYYSKSLMDTLHNSSRYVELELPHLWNLRSYPFDTQTLRYVFEASNDTSLMRISQVPDIPLSLPKNNDYLMDGYKVVDIKSQNSFKETTIISEFIEGRRNRVVERLEFIVSIDREGAFLYFKLFFGGFLSFLISFLVYFIKPEFFETRITLSLGGIFGAVGNKYFVENTMPSIQVLTKADIINNLVIIFIIINIFIVIGQHMENINLGRLEKNKFSAISVFILFILVNYFIVQY